MTNIYNLNKDELVLLISEIEERTRKEYEEKIAKLELKLERAEMRIEFLDPRSDTVAWFCPVKGCKCHFLYNNSSGREEINCENPSDICYECYEKTCLCHGDFGEFVEGEYLGKTEDGKVIVAAEYKCFKCRKE